MWDALWWHDVYAKFVEDPSVASEVTGGGGGNSWMWWYHMPTFPYKIRKMG